ncbi:response regulator transcription factor [Cupriavidus sp. D384]|uniref:response regulator transcription factor n=1 Tax=Cupriavidus sp. D384 TaxID=1538095 RepID=UPI000832F1A0|nr:response regulator transcription factor [Cupriavidus sp. D384]
MTALVIEDQPLVRLGMQRLLERMPGVGAVRALDPAGIQALEPGLETSIVVYGMSGDTSDNWYLLRRLHQTLPRARILLLSDNMWLHVPASLEPCGVVAHLPRSASVERMEAVVLQMLGCDGFVPMRTSMGDAWQLACHPRVVS